MTQPSIPTIDPAVAADIFKKQMELSTAIFNANMALMKAAALAAMAASASAVANYQAKVAK